MIGVTDYQPARLRALGDIMSEYQAPSSRNAWAASSESAFKGQRWYANTKHGAFVCQKEGDKEGYRSTKNGQ